MDEELQILNKINWKSTHRPVLKLMVKSHMKDIKFSPSRRDRNLKELKFYHAAQIT
jgi:hypothetical protein